MAVSNVSGKFLIILSTIGTLAKGSNGFGIVCVNGLSLVPNPPTKIIASMQIHWGLVDKY